MIWSIFKCLNLSNYRYHINGRFYRIKENHFTYHIISESKANQNKQIDND